MPIYEIETPDGRIMEIEGDKMPPINIIKKAYSELPPIDNSLEIPERGQVMPAENYEQNTLSMIGKALPYAGIVAKATPQGRALSAGATGVGRFLEGRSEGESLPTALKQSGKAAAIDLVGGKLISKGFDAFKGLKKGKGVSSTTFESAKDVLNRNRELFSGKKKIPTGSLSDPRYVDAVGTATADSMDALKRTFMDKQSNSIASGKLTKEVSNKIYSDLGKLDLDAPVRNQKVYNMILNRIADPDLTLNKLYETRRMADKAINWNERNILDDPLKAVRKNIDNILKNPKYNTKAKEYKKQTRNLSVLQENKAVKNLYNKSDQSRNIGKFGQGFISSGPTNQAYFRKAINTLKVDDKVQKKLKDDITEGALSLETSKAFQDIKAPGALRSIPYVGDLLEKGYKSTLPTQQRLNPLLTRSIPKIMAGSSGFTPIQERTPAGNYSPTYQNEIINERFRRTR